MLCYVYDTAGRVLLLHRRRQPNAGMYSPVGGKLDVERGEGPHDCAVREIREETGLVLRGEDVRLTGIVSEAAYESETHWLIFLFEVMPPVEPSAIKHMTMDEGTLEWVPADEVASMNIPETDRTIMWPLVRQHRGGFFMVHVECSERPMRWTVQESERRVEG